MSIELKLAGTLVLLTLAIWAGSVILFDMVPRRWASKLQVLCEYSLYVVAIIVCLVLTVWVWGK